MAALTAEPCTRRIDNGVARESGMHEGRLAETLRKDAMVRSWPVSSPIGSQRRTPAVRKNRRSAIIRLLQKRARRRRSGNYIND